MKKITSYKDFNNREIELFVKDLFDELPEIEVHEGDLIVTGNQRFFEDNKDKTIYITGDLIVSGTIGFFPTNERHAFIVGGDIIAKNFINVSNSHFFIGKNLKIEALSFFCLWCYNFKVMGAVSTKSLIHYGTITYPSNASFENEFNFQNNDYKYFKNIFYGIENGITIFYFVTLIKSLEKDETYIDENRANKLKRKLIYEKEQAQIKEKQFKEDEEYWSKNSSYEAFKAFKYALESFDVDNIELAGFKFIDNETQAKILGLYPPEDQLLRDERAKSGLYALMHADRPAYVKPNKTKKRGFEVASLDLLNRYSDLKSFMMETSVMYYKNIFYSLLENHTLSEIYENEKQYFNIDKELGLYWLIIFGLLNDKRYEEVERDIAHFDWKMITGAKEYFKRKEQNKISSAKEKMKFLNSLNLK